MSSIAAGTTTGSALVSTGDTTGELVLKTNGTTTAVTIDTNQNVTIEGDLTVNGTLIGGGDVVGPASATDNAITRFDGTTGKLVQNSSASVDDNGAATFVGAVNVSGTSTAGSNIKLYEDTDNGTNYVSLKAPDTIASDVTWTLPNADGTNGQVLSTNGSGVLSWASGGGGSGDVVGPASAVDGAIALFDGITGKLLKNGAVYTDTNTASTVVQRDASGNFSAGTVTAALTGNASTASTWQTARNLTLTSIYGTGPTKSLNGSSDISWSLNDMGYFSSISTAGYSALPNGSIIQWNHVTGLTAATTNYIHFFNTAFPNGVIGIIIQIDLSSSSGFAAAYVRVLSNTTASFTSQYRINIRWIAIGY